ncbi:MAG: hypothetical protein JWR01_2955 [Subtercola sp.]|nr:hypothetical protein [Subtercola sp.]
MAPRSPGRDRTIAGMASSERDGQLGEVFVMLADSLRPEHDVIDTMDILVQASTSFTSAVETGIVLADAHGVLHVVASSSERASEVEEVQLGQSEGPCLQSFQTGETVEIADITAEQTRWPTFAGVAEARGFLADHAVPLRLRGQTLGVMNLFSSERGPLSNRDAALVQAMADVATISIVQKQTVQHHVQVSEQLQYALDSRVLIEQAKGVISDQHGVPIDQAFVLLRSFARSNQARLHDVADRIVNRQLLI